MRNSVKQFLAKATVKGPPTTPCSNPALSVRCPVVKCGAAVGERCKTTKLQGKTRKRKVHSARRWSHTTNRKEPEMTTFETCVICGSPVPVSERSDPNEAVVCGECAANSESVALCWVEIGGEG